MRLIDADKLKEGLCGGRVEHCGDLVMELFCALVDTTPTIDAVPVMRCKDCRWWKLSPYNTAGIHTCTKFSGVRGEHDFCSRGEKMDGGADE